MRHQVRKILFVSSLYESFIMAEDGLLNELMHSKFLDLKLVQPPSLTQASTGAEALEALAVGGPFELVITGLHVGDMGAHELAEAVHLADPSLPVVLLAHDYPALKDFQRRHTRAAIERAFLWQGDARLLLAITKLIEDGRNAGHDARRGVPVFIVVEDSVRNYSAFLPVIYTEVMKHAERVTSEGVGFSQRLQRLRARPKILLATSFEEAWQTFSAFPDDVLGVISDVDFPREGASAPRAGLELARRIREARPDVPVALHSSRESNAALAAEVDAAFLWKNSPRTLEQLRHQLADVFSFGDFIFRKEQGGPEIARVRNLEELVEQVGKVPVESLGFHGARNDFSRWLRVRAEFELAARLRPRKPSDYPNLEELRQTLGRTLRSYLELRDRRTVADFRPGSLSPAAGVSRIGEGSLGGKARGLAFAVRLLDRSGLRDGFSGVRISVPPAAVLGTEVFEAYLDENGLRGVALESEDDVERERRFAAARLPEVVEAELVGLVAVADFPLAVRSSSLLEDSPYQPFAGVFATFMLPNVRRDPAARLRELVRAITRVYASAFSSAARSLLRATPFRLEEGEMAVIIQPVVGRRRGRLFYPDFAGVARSHNFYPMPPARTGDGVAAVALGLGHTVVAGERCLRFSPAYPQHVPALSTVEDALENAQREFWALDLGDDAAEAPLVRSGLDVAERDGVLAGLGSTYLPDSDAIIDGISRPGVRLVSFAPILKHGAFPLAEILRELLALGSRGVGGPVEIEFAVNLSRGGGEPAEFAFLQLRPSAPTREHEVVEIGDLDDADLVCRSAAVMGNGRLDQIRDVLVVARRLDRARAADTARQVSRMNAKLTAAGARYILIGAGRWGSRQPQLGIPVAWEDIAGAAVIVEASFEDRPVQPSEGSHFFQNLAAFNTGYFTVDEAAGGAFLDWDWLRAQPCVEELGPVRHLRFQEPLVVVMNGRTRAGVVLKPFVPAPRR